MRYSVLCRFALYTGATTLLPLLAGGWLVTPAIAQQESSASASAGLAAVDLCESLRPSIEFEKDSYQSGDTAKVIVTLTNVGSATLTGIVTGGPSGQPNELVWDNSDWGELASSGPGLTLEPDQTKIVEGVGTIPSVADDYGRVYVLVPFVLKDGSSTCNPALTASALVPRKFGDITGRAVDAENGAGVPGVIVAAFSLNLDYQCAGTTKSDANGDFRLADLPAGDYIMAYVPPPGWKAKNGYSDNASVGARGEPLTFELVRGDSGIPYRPGPGCDAEESPPATTTTSAPASSTTTTTAAPVPQARTGPELAKTGVRPVVPVVVGLGLLGIGCAAVVAARRRLTNQR